MAETTILEVSSLNERHPKLDLFEECAIKLITRLAVDPRRLGSEVAFRDIVVQHRARNSPDVQTQWTARIDWSGLRHGLLEKCDRRRRTVNADRLTEDAAIGIMALVIHELESATIASVLPKGEGADYEVMVEAEGREFEVEVSGIRQDSTQAGSVTSKRLAEKCEQLFVYKSSGFVSVTTFAYSSTREVRSYLHFVRQQDSKLGNRRRPKGRLR